MPRHVLIRIPATRESGWGPLEGRAFPIFSADWCVFFKKNPTKDVTDHGMTDARYTGM